MIMSTLNLGIDAASRVGLVRRNNEDMILVGDRLVRDDTYQSVRMIGEDGMFIVALADGMGGHNAGERASEIVLGSLKRIFSMPWQYLDASRFIEAAYLWLEHVTRYINKCGDTYPHQKNMGTTLVGMMVNYNDLYWVNCGDSRIYLFRDDHLEQLSTDHSLSNITGDITNTGAIVNCIGAGCESSYLDMVEMHSAIRHNDVYMLCSDGLSDMLFHEDIEQCIRDGATADQLCQRAEDAGGRDNISVCLIKIL